MMKQQEIWISVDGGGTKTQMCGVDRDGKMIYNQIFASSNYKSTSLEETTENLSCAFQNLFGQLNCTAHDIIGVVLGIAGCDTEEDIKIYQDILVKLGFFEEQLKILNDSELVFRSLTDSSGICVVTGTGSIVCAYDKDNLLDRIGGWNAPLSDLGSGYWIGSEILKKMLLWIDGIETNEYEVYQVIQNDFQKTGMDIANTIGKLSVSQIASISPRVFECAERGDELCQSVISCAEEWIVRQIVTLVKRVYLKMRKEIPIVLVGGVYKKTDFKKIVEQNVVEQCKGIDILFLEPERDPAEEGIKYCRRIFL